MLSSRPILSSNIIKVSEEDLPDSTSYHHFERSFCLVALLQDVAVRLWPAAEDCSVEDPHGSHRHSV